MTTEKRDYYEVLRVERSASIEEIKLSYKKLARTYHPDVAENKADAEIHFREINEAYSVLSDHDKRAHYDRFGHAPPSGGGFGGFGGSPFGDMFDLGDIFESVFGMGGMRGGPNRPQRGQDIKETLQLTLEQVFTGTERELTVNTYQDCSTCNGTRSKPGTKPTACGQCGGAGQVKAVTRTPFGQVIRTAPCVACSGQGQTITDPCEDCKGAGHVFRKKRVNVKVPPGVDSGNYIRMSGLGDAGTNGGPPGDLFVVLEVKGHEVYQREGDDLFLEKAVTFTDAALGTEVEIPTLEGPTRIKIPAGMQSHTTFKVRGKGLPSARTRARGDLHARVIVMVPTHLNEKQKQLLKEYAGAGSQEAQGSNGRSWFGRIMDAILG
ncbi:MAG: molecular chaperone DnaJ [Armatimonadetes bacterium]|nr:molecular chaperone DnaJ [Armatimonadota bacterium]